MPDFAYVHAIAQRLAPTAPAEQLAGASRAVEHKLSGNPASDAEIEAALIGELGAASPHVAAPAPPLPEMGEGMPAQPATPETDADPQNPNEPAADAAPTVGT